VALTAAKHFRIKGHRIEKAARTARLFAALRMGIEAEYF
jgi:hypothetical protein